MLIKGVQREIFNVKFQLSNYLQSEVNVRSIIRIAEFADLLIAMRHWLGTHYTFAVEQYLRCGKSLVRARRTVCTI